MGQLPGEILKEEFLNEIGVSQNQLAQAIGVPGNRIHAILARSGIQAIVSRQSLNIRLVGTTLAARKSRMGLVLRGCFEIGCQSCNSSSSALASFKSSVSKPSVNQP